MILAAGAAGKRFVLPNSKVMIHQGSGGFRGTRRTSRSRPSEILSLTRRYGEIIAKHANRDVEQVMRDIDRDRFLGPEDAIEYGLADHVLATRSGSRLRQRLSSPREAVRTGASPRTTRRTGGAP